MGRLAVILGSSATGPAGEEVAAAAEQHASVVLQRHGSTEAYLLPHRIDHAANLRSLTADGCERVLAICSVGSLRAGLAVGSFLCPHDFIDLQTTITTFDDARGHATPGFDSDWREQVLAAWQESGAGDLREGGVYWQTNGPRFETAAEIRVIAAHADVVGMTLASECIVAGELGLRYAAVCVVDNLANGIAVEPLSPDEVERHRAANAIHLRDALDAVLPLLTPTSDILKS
jgi:5'-methylthioadenosine phosphorylase